VEKGMKLILNPEFLLYEKDGRPFCDSLQVAAAFNKRHDNVLRDIQDLHCSDNFRLLNFDMTKYKDGSGKKQPKYVMTKDGFLFLVMGYRGKKAGAIREAYILHRIKYGQ
jgi:Rha family phage regulatory protein